MTADLVIYLLNATVAVVCGATAGWHYKHGCYGWAGATFILALLNVGHAVVS